MDQDRYAVLDGKEVRCVSLMEWAEWFGKHSRRVAKTEVGDVEVSTVFLGLDHGWGKEKLWFETLVFGGEHDGYMDRYETWDEAVEGHEKVVGIVNGKIILFNNEQEKRQNVEGKEDE